MHWDMTADVVIVGAGVAGLPAAITARDLNASVIIVEENYDIGGRGMLSGGRVQLGGGHALQQKFNIKDDADQVFLDWVRADDAESRYSDRDLVRVYADENVSAYQFLIDNGVEFIEKPIGPGIDASTVARIFVTKEWHIPAAVVAPHRNRNGSGLVRHLAASARKKGAQILLKHKMTRIIREKPTAGKVLGIEVKADGKTINIRATKGVIIATGGQEDENDRPGCHVLHCRPDQEP
jgi:succinate dehydrogenase/fumarate reductase flavoprotein subunit